MQVSHDDIDSYFPVFENLNSKLNEAANGNFSYDKIATISTKVNGIDFTNWQDKVATKVNKKVTDLKDSTVYSIEKSLENEFGMLVTVSAALVGAANTYKSVRETYKTAKADYENAQANYSASVNSSDQTVRENAASLLSTVQSLESKVTKEKENYDKALDNVNAQLAMLEGVCFVPRTRGDGSEDLKYEAPKEEPKEDPVETEDYPRDNTTELLEDAVEVEDGVYKVEDYDMNGVEVDVYIDTKTGNRVYYNSENGKVMVVCLKDDGHTEAWFTSTSDKTLFNLDGLINSITPRTVEQALTDLLTDHRSEEYALYRYEVSGYETYRIRSGESKHNYTGMEEMAAEYNKAGFYF